MKRIFWLSLIIPIILFSQQELRILSYDVRAVLNERNNEIAGNVFVRIDSRTTPTDIVTFLVPIQWEIYSIRDENNDSYDFERSPSDHYNCSRIDLEQTSDVYFTDTLFLNIEFKASVDSSSLSTMFLNTSEILLPCEDSTTWIPRFGSTTMEQGSLEITIATPFVLFSAFLFDTIMTEGSRRWKIEYQHTTSLSSAFTVCGINSTATQKVLNTDSTHTVSFNSSPHLFNQRYAAAISEQLHDAIRFFSTVTGQKRLPDVRYAIVGGPTFEPEIFHTNNFIIHRNSPAFTSMDSLALNRIQYNHWLFETAQRFCPVTDDSTALFDDGFAAYLCMRYLAATHPKLAREERLTTIAHALTFFPSGTIAAGHYSPGTTNEIVSYRGRYIFVMLEYLLGKESFDSVIVRMFEEFSAARITFSAFQQLCEDEYGSSLEWFFEQWLRRSIAPEFVIQWKYDTTPRGMSIITVTVEQRGELFSMPVPIVFSFGSRSITKRILVEQAKQEFLFTFPSPPTSVDLDPNLSILRWLLEIRISAHARTSLQYLSLYRDIANAEREAQYTLQLDPNNSTGSAPLVYFVLGNSAAAANDFDKGKEYFLKAMSSGASTETEKYKLLSLVQYANILEAENKRDEAVTAYRRAISEGMKNPVVYERAIIKAELHLRGSFNSQADAWFELH
ncbi:MAG: hypothetical protein WCX28_04655 [Bacteriovoracaceae bacterium]|nr:hypothetical protein [Bacteroidota bacterium]